MFTMDDGVNPSNYEKYSKLFDGKKNPDGGQQKATFFVCGKENNFDLTKKLFDKGTLITILEFMSPKISSPKI